MRILKTKDKTISFLKKLQRYYQEEDTPVRKRGTVLRAVSKRWPNGEVPYVLEDAFDENFRVCSLGEFFNSLNN